MNYLTGTNESIINGGFENDVISSNYEYIDISEWNSVTHDNKTLISKNGQIPTQYFVEINSSMPNSYYRDITLEQNKDYTFEISHRAHIRSNTTGEFTFDELAIILGPKQTINSSQNSNKKDQFMQITSWLKENSEEIAGNNISNKYVVYSSRFTENGSFETDGFSFTKTAEYTEKWLIWIVKSSTYNFFDYTVIFNSEELEDCIVALSSVSSGYIGNNQISYGNIVKKFKIYNNDNTLLDFDLQKIYEDNQTTFSTIATKGYGTFDALNGTTPPITDNWWNVTEPSKEIEFGYFSSSKNAYSLQEISKVSGFEGKQFIVADNIYQNVNIGNNKSLEVSFMTKSLNLLPNKPNRIYVFNTTNIPSMNSETKKTQLDLISEYLNKDYLAETNETSIIYTASFDSNGLFTVPIEEAFSDTLDDIHTVEIYYVEYPSNTSDTWKKRSQFIELTDTGIKNEISIYFNSNTYAGESNLLDNVEISYTTEKEFLDAEFEGKGTEVEPYLIKNEEDFIKFRTYAYNSKSEFLDLYFKQTADITFTSDLTALEIPSFAGIYDGAGHILNNVNISSSVSRAKVSMFFELTGTIRNLGIKNATITGWSTSGIADSITEKGVIENCFVQAILTNTNSTESYAAGIASSINKNAKIINTYFYGTQNAATPFGIGAYRANSTPTFINVFSNIDPNISTYNATGSNPTITNSSTKTLTEMQTDEFLNILNEYTMTDSNLVSWDFDTENGLPTLVPDVVNPELKKLYVKNTDDGNDLIWINKNNQYYLYLSKNIDRKNMVTNYITNNKQIEVYAYDKDNNLLGKIENDIPNNYFDKDKVVIKLKYKGNLSTEYEINIMQSDLPSVYLNLSPTEFETADQLLNQINNDPDHDIGFPGVAYIRNSNDELTTASFKKMKGRGNATWTYSKRPYQVKFNEKISILGMKPSKTWLFITNYTDGSLSRSATFYKLAQDLGIDYAIEFETADVYINGKYNGTYLVTSKVEKDVNRVDITNNDSLIEIDNYVDTYQFTSNITNHKFTIKYPDLEEETTEIQNEKIQYNKKLIDNLESKIYDQNVSYDELSQIIDMESFAKAYWVFEISENYDAMYGSTYIYTKDNLIHMGPMWDFDNTLNMLSKNNTSLKDYYLLGTTGGAQANRVRWFNELMKRQEFSDLIDKIFLENIDIFKNLANEASKYNQKIQKSALMNYSRYPYSEMKNEKPYYMGGNSFEEASNNLISSITTRTNFYLNEYKDLDIEKIKYTITDVDNNNITDTVKIDEVIRLPNTITEDADIELIGITKDNVEREIPTIKLDKGIYQGKFYISNNVSITCDKKTNRSSYMLSLERDEKDLKELKIITKPNKTEYYEEDLFDKTGMIIHAVYTDNTFEEITNYSVNKTILSLNDTNIEISYENKSVTLPITVKENTIKSIEIKQLPNKTNYVEGEVFDPSGMKVVVVKVNGMEKEITDYTYNKDKLTMDDTKITISYQNFTSDITITVEENIVVKLEMTTKPNKLNYIEGETFNPDGLTLIATYKDGSTKKITDYTYNKNKLTLSDETIEIEYLGFSESVSITVNESPIKEITIKTKPTKLTYVEGEVFDPSGMKVVAVKVNGMEKEITDYTYNKNKLTTSDTEIEITYAEYKVSLSITVTKVQDDNKNNTENVKPEVIKPEVIKPAINIPNNTTDEAEEYTFVSGENQTIDKNNRNKLRLEINANSKLLSRILINGKQLSEKDYTIDKDKLIIEINDEYLSTLDNDENIVEIALTNGQVIKTKLYINEEDNEKPIIDNTDKNEEIQTNKEPFNKNWLYSLLIIPVVYFIIAFVKRKKDN